MLSFDIAYKYRLSEKPARSWSEKLHTYVSKAVDNYVVHIEIGMHCIVGCHMGIVNSKPLSA